MCCKQDWGLSILSLLIHFFFVLLYSAVSLDCGSPVLFCFLNLEVARLFPKG